MNTSSYATVDSQSVASYHHSFDVVVVGYGGAGASAAIAAHDSGAKVAIFDVASAPGGSTALSSAELYLGGGTRIQKACGYDDTPQAMYDYLMASNGPQADSEKIRAYCDGSVEHFNWLEQLGVPFKESEYKQRAMMALSDDCLLYTGNEKTEPFVSLAAPAPPIRSAASLVGQTNPGSAAEVVEPISVEPSCKPPSVLNTTPAWSA